MVYSSDQHITIYKSFSAETPVVSTKAAKFEIERFPQIIEKEGELSNLMKSKL